MTETTGGATVNREDDPRFGHCSAETTTPGPECHSIDFRISQSIWAGSGRARRRSRRRPRYRASLGRWWCRMCDGVEGSRGRAATGGLEVEDSAQRLVDAGHGGGINGAAVGRFAEAAAPAPSAVSARRSPTNHPEQSRTIPHSS